MQITYLPHIFTSKKVPLHSHVSYTWNNLILINPQETSVTSLTEATYEGHPFRKYFILLFDLITLASLIPSMLSFTPADIARTFVGMKTIIHEFAVPGMEIETSLVNFFPAPTYEY